MSDICCRCGRKVEKLIPIDDAYRSAEESATWSGLLEVPWPQTYTEYVCLTCARKILNITEEDLIHEERLTKIETEFHINLLKGRLAQVIIEAIFQEFGYEVYPYGYESNLTNIIKFLRKPDANIPVRKLRATPDIFVYDREVNDGFFIEIKATNTPDETSYWISKSTLDTYNAFWSEAILTIYCLLSMNIYCCKIQDIHIEQLPIVKSPVSGHENYIINLKSEFLTLPDFFRLIEPTRYNDFINRIRGVIKNLHTPTV